MKYLQIATDTDEPKLTNVDSSNNDTFAIDSIAVGCDEGRLGDKYAELIRRLEQAKSKIVDIDRVLKTR
jgi:hypothetical protein